MAVYTITLEDQVSAPAKSAAEAVRGLGEALRGLAGAMGGATQAAQGMAPAMQQALGAIQGTGAASTAATPAAAGLPPQLLAIGAAATAAAAAVATVAVALYQLGLAAIGFSETRARTKAAFDAFTDGAGGETLAALKQLSQELPFSGAQINDWGKKLAVAGFAGEDLTRSVRAVAAATALMGDEGGAAATTLLQRLKTLSDLGAPVKFDRRLVNMMREAGVQVSDLAARLGTTPDHLKSIGVSADKLGQTIQQSMIEKGATALDLLRNSLDGIGTEISKGIGLKELFSDLDPVIKPFMVELRSFAEEFFKGSVAAGAAKGAVTSVFTALFQAATQAVEAIHIGFLEAEIAILRVAIAVAPTVKQMRALWAEAQASGAVTTTLNGLVIIFEAIAIAVGVVVGVVALVAFAFVAMVGQIAYGVGAIGPALSAAGQALVRWTMSAYDAAANFVHGLADGITAGASWVITAVEGLATGAIGAFKKLLKINSPSVVMADLGVNFAEGAAAGIESGTAEVAHASSEMGRAGRDGFGGAPGGGHGEGGGGSYTLNASLVINNYGGDVGEQVEDGFGSLLERLAMQAGIVPASAVTA